MILKGGRLIDNRQEEKARKVQNKEKFRNLDWGQMSSSRMFLRGKTPLSIKVKKDLRKAKLVKMSKNPKKGGFESSFRD